MLEPKPKYKNGVPICSKYDCPCFSSDVEPGWGISLTCYSWDKKKHGLYGNQYGDFPCYPFIDKQSKLPAES